MNRLIIAGKHVWIVDRFVPAKIYVENGVIVKVLPFSEGESESEDVDYYYDEAFIYPGFIDIHTHGSYGFDTNDAEPEGLKNWIKNVTEEGVTAILPTTVTQMPDVLSRAVANVADVVKEGYDGAEILGIHLEGPFIDSSKKGAQPEEAIAVPNVEQFKKYQEAAEGLIKYITLSPEHDEDFALTRYCSGNGVTVSAGHSSATFETVLYAMANGVTSMTHVYNGMTGLHHREPGMVGSALVLDELYGEIIGDGMHVSKEAVKLFFDRKGNDHGILITDSLRAKHCHRGGVYDLGGHEIEINEDGLALLKGTNTIAGSTLSMNRGLKFLIKEAGVSPLQAINAATLNPARVLGVAERKGKIAAGFDADFAVLDIDYNVVTTFCKGRSFIKQK